MLWMMVADIATVRIGVRVTANRTGDRSKSLPR
ncbi:MAG: hypothetical protein QOE61_4324 [Micromonosporaceae bacterium]|jgi:hypothetical protein|nr:hypothetical protein [Micromonosporaceae bacterium]